MIKRKLLLLALVLLLISVGLVVAQSSTNYTMQRFVMMSGGAADSANYSVTSVNRLLTLWLAQTTTYRPVFYSPILTL